MLTSPSLLLSIAQSTPELDQKSAFYLHIIALAIPAALGFRIYSEVNNAIGSPNMATATQMVALLLKFPLNYLFIFCCLGILATGGAMASTLFA